MLGVNGDVKRKDVSARFLLKPVATLLRGTLLNILVDAMFTFYLGF